MTLTVTFKALSGNILVQNIENPDVEKISDYTQKIRQHFKIDEVKYNKLRYINKGKLLNEGNMTFTEAGITDQSPLIVVMAIKSQVKNEETKEEQKESNEIKEQLNEEIPENTNIETTSMQQNTDVTQNESTNSLSQPLNPYSQFLPSLQTEQTYTVDQIQICLPLFFLYLQTNPNWKTLYDEQPHLLPSALLNTNFRKVVEQIMGQYNEIANGIENGTVQINVPLTNSNDDEQYDDNSDNDTSDDESEDLQINNDQLTEDEQDNENIKKLIELGASPEQAFAVYLMCGKNAEMAASMLFDLLN